MRFFMICRFILIILIAVSFLPAQCLDLGIERYGGEFTFLPDDLDGITRLSGNWVRSQHPGKVPDVDSTVSQAIWQSGDFGLSDVRVFFSPVSSDNRWILSGQWLTYEGYSQLKKNDFLAVCQSPDHTLKLSVVNTKPKLYNPLSNQFTQWDARTHNLNWHMKKSAGNVDIESYLDGQYGRFKPNRGDSLLTGNTQYAEMVGGLILFKDWWSVNLEGEWYESWPGDDHFRFSQVNLVPTLYHPFGEAGFTLSSNNESGFCYEGWIAFSQWGLSAKIALEARFYPAVLITRYGAETEADFVTARFAFDKSFGRFVRLRASHHWSYRRAETYALQYNTSANRVEAVNDDPALLMQGEGSLEIGKGRFMAGLSWNYRDFNGLEYLWYHPGRVNIMPGIQAGTTLFKNLDLTFRVEGLWQAHDDPGTLYFIPELPGFVPGDQYSGDTVSDWTLNGKISARVKTLIVSAGIENALQQEVYTARNLMPNDRMFVLNVKWLWYR